MDRSSILLLFISIPSYHSSRGGLPFSTLHHSEGSVPQFFIEGEVSFADEAGEIRRLAVWWSRWRWWAAENLWSLGIRVRPLPGEHLLTQTQRLRLRVIPPASALHIHQILIHPNTASLNYDNQNETQIQLKIVLQWYTDNNNNTNNIQMPSTMLNWCFNEYVNILWTLFSQ